MDNGYQGDGSSDWCRRLLGWSAERQQLAPGRAVDHVPAAIAKLHANRVCGLEVTGAPALDPFVEEFLSLDLIQNCALRAPG